MKHATEPFDDPSANAILRSADGVDFRVVKRILSGMSHVFTQLFERGSFQQGSYSSHHSSSRNQHDIGYPSRRTHHSIHLNAQNHSLRRLPVMRYSQQLVNGLGSW